MRIKRIKEHALDVHPSAYDAYRDERETEVQPLGHEFDSPYDVADGKQDES